MATRRGQPEVGRADTQAVRVGARRLGQSGLFCLAAACFVAGCGGGGSPAPKEVAAGVTPPTGCAVTVLLGKRASGGVFRVEDATRKQVDQVRTLLRGDRKVKTFAYIPKKLMLHRLFRKYPSLTKNLTGNPLPDSFEVVPEQRQAASPIAASLRSLAGVLNVTTSAACGVTSSAYWSLHLTVPLATPKPPSPDRKKALARQVKQRLAAARTRRRVLIAANRIALDALPRSKGSKLLGEWQNPESDVNVNASPGEVRLDQFVRVTLPGDDYDILIAQGWGTFRTYSVPAGTTPLAVYDFFTKRLAGHWMLVHEESDPSRAAPYRVDFQKGRRCLWFLIGIRNDGSTLPIGRTFEVGTDLATQGLTC
jgi:hypothetical protein